MEGKVVGQKSFVADDGEVYTENRIEISQILKGAYEQHEISVVTWGGNMGSYEVSWTHLASLSHNQFGVFFLVPTEIDIPLPLLNNRQFYDIYASSQGFYQIMTKNEGGMTALSAIDIYEDASDLYRLIGKDLRPAADFIHTQNNSKEDCIVFKIVPILDGPEDLVISAGIYVRSKEGSHQLYKSNLKTEYDKEIFGEYVVDSYNLTYDNGDFPPSVYNLNLSDISSNKFDFTLQANTIDLSQLVAVDTVFKLIAVLHFKLATFPTQNPFDWENNSGTIENYYIDKETGLIKEFECTEVENEACDIEVTGFAPMTAAGGVGLLAESGASGTVTINGSGFTNPTGGEIIPEGYRVKFETVGGSWISPFEGDYITWTNNSIQVKVPSIGYDDNSQDIITDFNRQIAATGKIRVCEDTYFLGIKIGCGCNDDTSTDLYIPFSARNTYQTRAGDVKESVRTVLRSFNGSGGYSIYFKPGFRANAGAVAAFKRALNTWRCDTQVNFDVNEVDDPPGAANGVCVVEFANLPIGVGSITRGSTAFSLANCGAAPNIDFSYLPDFLIRFNQNLTWHTGTNMPTLDWNTHGDLQSTALHELGHAHLLNHTNNLLNVMVSPGPLAFRRALTADDSDGGNHLSMLSHITNDLECPSAPMDLTLPGDCMVEAVEIDGVLADVVVYPNPSRDVVQIEFTQSNNKIIGDVIVFDVIGRKMISNAVQENQAVLNLSGISQGIYHLILADSNGKRTIIGKLTKI